MDTHSAYILMGGNIGDVLKSFAEAKSRMAAFGKIAEQSQVYRTPPWGMESAHDFLNQVVHLETELSPEKLLEQLLQVEQALGRERKEGGSYQDRPLDLDMLFYDELVLETERLQLPHPRMHLRKFTLLPLVEIASCKLHPVFGKSISTLLAQCPDQSRIEVHAV